MKKYLFIATIAVVAMAACTKVEIDENVPAQKITFQAANYVPQTKASAADPSFTAFTCKGYLHAEGINLDENHAPTSALGKQDFFGNADSTPAFTETITFHDGTPVTWTPSHDYYWPKSAYSYVNFVGWYGKTSAGAASHPSIAYEWDNTASAYKATLSWSFTQGALGNTTSDYLYADMAWRYNSTPAATYTDVSRVASGVPMLFHHALAQINIKAYVTSASSPAISTGTGGDSNKVTDGLAKWTITLENVQLTNVNTSGTLTMTNTDPGSEHPHTPQEWTKDGTGWTGTGATSALSPSTCTVYKTTKDATANDLIALTCVLPQSLNKTNAISKLTGKVHIVTEYANATNEELIPFEYTLEELGTTTWEQNKKYTYYLKINPSQSKVAFDPAIAEDYQDGTTTEQVIPNAGN